MCHKIIGIKRTMYEHMLANHENDSYQCKICQKPFTLMWNAKKEMGIIPQVSSKTLKCYENQKCYSCEDQNSSPGWIKYKHLGWSNCQIQQLVYILSESYEGYYNF